MDNKYFEVITKELATFFSENNVVSKDGYYANENKAVKIAYSEERKMFTLSVADIDEGVEAEYREINAWLFDENCNEKDAVSVGLDFLISLRKEFGVKTTRASLVNLPTASKDGYTNISAFTKKILDVFPALKDEYKNHVSNYGEFLYLNFYGEHLRPRLIRLFEEGTKKQIKKFYDVIEVAFTKGDRATVNLSVLILVAAAYKNQKVTDIIKETLNENKTFLSSFESMIPFFASNSKLLKTMIRE